MKLVYTHLCFPNQCPMTATFPGQPVDCRQKTCVYCNRETKAVTLIVQWNLSTNDLRIKDISLIRTLHVVLRVSVIERFHCNKLTVLTWKSPPKSWTIMKYHRWWMLAKKATPIRPTVMALPEYKQ